MGITNTFTKLYMSIRDTVITIRSSRSSTSNTDRVTNQVIYLAGIAIPAFLTTADPIVISTGIWYADETVYD